MSRQDIVTLRLTLSALFITFLVIASLLANITSSLHSSSALHSQPVEQHHDDNPNQNGGMLDALAQTAAKSFSESWAYYSPYHPAAPFEGSTRKGCVVSQANIVSRDSRLHHTFLSIRSAFQLQRHGARYPTSGATEVITAALAKFQAAAGYNDTKLDFINGYTYDLGMDDLVQYGVDQ